MKQIAKRFNESDIRDAAYWLTVAMDEGFNGTDRAARAVWLHREAKNKTNARARAKSNYQAWADFSGAAYRGMCRRQWAMQKRDASNAYG